MTQNDGIHGKAKAKNWAVHTSKLERSKIDLKVNAWMWTEIDLNESEIDLNECEYFLKANLDLSEMKSIQVKSILFYTEHQHRSVSAI